MTTHTVEKDASFVRLLNVGEFGMTDVLLDLGHLELDREDWDDSQLEWADDAGEDDLCDWSP